MATPGGRPGHQQAAGRAAFRGIGECAEQGEHSSGNPNQEREADGASDLAEDGAGRSKDAGANDRADEEKKKIAKAKRANEFGHEFAGA